MSCVYRAIQQQHSQNNTQTVSLLTSQNYQPQNRTSIPQHWFLILHQKNLKIPPRIEVHDSFLEDTLNLSFRDNSKDMSYHVDSETDSNPNESVIEICPSAEEKYIVFKSCIHDLIIRLKCPHCEKPVDVDDIVYETGNGTVLVCTVHCLNGHLVYKWNSQPFIGKMPAGNLLTSAAILYSGQTYTRVAQFANFLNLQFISHTTYEKIQRQQLMPVIMDTWLTVQKAFLSDVRTRGKPLRLAGDGRCDSPGFSAKYCTYSLMDLDSDAIVTFVVVQVTETGSSSRMEAEGFRRCMHFLLDEGFTIQVLATDRHAQIRSIVKKEFTATEHQFDVWHLSNSVKKKLTQKAKLKGAEDLGPWIKAICNHLWWCASQCNGDADWLEESWTSVVYHVCNVHEFEGDKFTRCSHEPLTMEQVRKKKWLKVGTRAHNSLREVVLDKRLRKDIRQLSKFCHTGGLEVFHSMMTKYVPKRQEFDFDQMAARTALAALDHNMSLGRQQKTNSDGALMYKAVFPKASGQWVAKPVYTEKSYEWVSSLLRRTVEQKEDNFLPPTVVKKKENIAPRPAPSKSSLVDSLKSRFKMNS